MITIPFSNRKIRSTPIYQFAIGEWVEHNGIWGKVQSQHHTNTTVLVDGEPQMWNALQCNRIHPADAQSLREYTMRKDGKWYTAPALVLNFNPSNGYELLYQKDGVYYHDYDIMAHNVKFVEYSWQDDSDTPEVF